MSYAAHLKSSEQMVVRCAIITLSDTRTLETDVSGNRIAELVGATSMQVVNRRILPDDASVFTADLKELLAWENVDVILTTGGTGISRRDQTIDLIEKMLDQPIPGFGELFRSLSYQQIGSGAMLSRAVGGIVGRKLIFAMPGSTAAVDLAMTQLILPELKHLIYELRK